MKFTELNPQWVGAGGEGISDSQGHPVPARQGIGVHFDCPCGCGTPCYVPFANPLDGGPASDPARPLWQRSGENFETLTLSPSILRDPAKGGCGWHGFITNGEIVNA
jgi:hypothetical protein